MAEYRAGERLHTPSRVAPMAKIVRLGEVMGRRSDQVERGGW